MGQHSKLGCLGRRSRRRRVLPAIALFLMMLAGPSWAEHHASRTYSTADGLPSNMVTCNYRDSHGFLWFCTDEGLSRFDGYTFTNYGVDQGLPDRYVSVFVETRSGDYWVGTARGLVRFNPRPGRGGAMFIPVGDQPDQTRPITDVVEDRSGTVWIAMGGFGVRSLVQENGQWSPRSLDLNLPPAMSAEGLLVDNQNNLWIALYGDHATLLRRSPDGHLDTFSTSFFQGNRITSLTQDRQNNIWLGTYLGLALLAQHPQAGGRFIEHVYAKWDPRIKQAAVIQGLFQSSDGRRWTRADVGLFEMLGDPQKGKVKFQFIGKDVFVPSLEDNAGNFWAFSTKYPRDGFMTYEPGPEDGLATEDVRSIFEGNAGELYVVTGINCRHIHRFDGQRFIPVAPYVPGHSASWEWGGWGWGQTHLQDHLGEWWFATGHGVFRYPKVKRLEDLAHTPPKAIYPKPHDIFRLFEDSRGDIWISAWDGVGWWERATEKFHSLADTTVISAFREDRAGNVWLGRWTGDLTRYRNGQFETIFSHNEFHPGPINWLFLDQAGRMWAGTTRAGLLRFDNPTSDHPTYKVYSTKNGLSSNDVRAITEDHFGRIYFWTGRGVDRLHPDTGRIGHYSEADGLVRAVADHNVAYCDRHGTVWIGMNGLNRLDPEPDTPRPPPPIRITRVRIHGADYPVSELGLSDLSGLVLSPNENQVQIEFASLNFATGDILKYQYKLDGADRDWSALTDFRTVNYPRLSPGTYRFLVRAVNSDGQVSELPASIGFRLLPPLWMRWWFLTAASLLTAVIIYWAYRLRLQQLLELERVRTRIASDLHDDIGSSLTQIAIMSEVARKQDGNRISEPLERIADLSRELVDSMSDIVWAINPKRDQLSDLIQRMRRFANDVLEAADVEVSFRTVPEQTDTPLHADLRRELFLIFKEAVNNVARHAQCDRVDIVVELKGSELLMSIRDNGRGFRAEPDSSQGHGLTSMRDRARRLGGDITVNSEPATGTTLALSVPLEHSSSVGRRKQRSATLR